MKAIIDGLCYDTDKARVIGTIPKYYYGTHYYSSTPASSIYYATENRRYFEVRTLYHSNFHFFKPNEHWEEQSIHPATLERIVRELTTFGRTEDVNKIFETEKNFLKPA